MNLIGVRSTLISNKWGQIHINFFVIHRSLCGKKINVDLTPFIDQINVDLTPIKFFPD